MVHWDLWRIMGQPWICQNCGQPSWVEPTLSSFFQMSEEVMFCTWKKVQFKNFPVQKVFNPIAYFFTGTGAAFMAVG